MHQSWMFFLLLIPAQGRIVLYHTENDLVVEQYDCIYHTSSVAVTYCRRLGEAITLNRSRSACFSGGERLSFRTLLEQNISPQEILLWNSSLERADEYAAFFYADNESAMDQDEFLCRCIQPGTFGKFCEYQFLDAALTFEQSIEQQFEEKRKNSWAAQRHGTILCYITLSCDSGLLCLDWRNICDGEQQCSAGYDEYNCDLLEFNECDDDEFRCVNGMCIPEEYWLDGEADCMDRSDEKEYDITSDCFFRPAPFRCDESFCGRHLWSCGDGQCIDAWNRFSYQRLFPPTSFCFNHREMNHMCEANQHWSLWTLPETGLCTNEVGYDDPTLDMAQTASSIDQRCVYLIRCALSRGFERDCPCNHLNCSTLLIEQCLFYGFYRYPKRSLIRPYIYSEYYPLRPWFDRSPDQYVFAGELLCRGYYGTVQLSDREGFFVDADWIQFPYNQLDWRFCWRASTKNVSGPHIDSLCWSNRSWTFNQRSYALDPDLCPKSHQCLSHYRMRDLVVDCHDRSDEETENVTERFCRNVRRHRLSCSAHEPYCIPTYLIDSAIDLCSDGYGWSALGSDRPMNSIFCRERNDVHCQLLRDHIGNSSVRNSTSLDVQQFSSQSRIPFHRYCDSFWDLTSHLDESPKFCQSWICPKDQYRCRTGQCIPLEWLCDGQWDCLDASDEEALLAITNFTAHNLNLEDFSHRIGECHRQYSNRTFSKLCDTSSELPCFLGNVAKPLDIHENRPCISFQHIGDQQIDCVAGYDEKNTLANHLGRMLGFDLPGSDGKTYDYKHVCSQVYDIPDWPLWCFYRNPNSSVCSDEMDVICLNGTCQPNARCNGKLECEHGEDEYRCPIQIRNVDAQKYRADKQSIVHNQSPRIRRNIYPSVTSRSASSQSKPRRIMTTAEEENSFICNRGLTVNSTDEGKVCLCPPAYFGKRCEYFNDRLTVICHVNLTGFVSSPIFRIIITLEYHDVIISSDQLFIDGRMEKEKYVKHRLIMLYSRLEQFMVTRRNRRLQRQVIIDDHPYSIHMYLFQLTIKETSELGQWIYPIYFDFLPSFRLAKILTIDDRFLNQTYVSPLNHTCPADSISLPIFNQPTHRYCSTRSLCRPRYRRQPLCVCPLGYFGPRCHLRHEECRSQPCLNNGTCHVTYDPTGQQPFRCECTSQFYGDRCERRKAYIQIQLNITDSTTDASVVQFCDIHEIMPEILVRNQQLIRGLPSTVSYDYTEIHVPTLSILKTYTALDHFKYFIIYLLRNGTATPFMSTPIQCLSVIILLDQKSFNERDGIPMVFKYHQLCRRSSTVLCFYASEYLCLCEPGHDRAYCYLHDLNTDQCHYCLSRGRCLRGDLKNNRDYFCICPRCYQGDRCQFAMQAFASTIDSLLSSHSSTIRLVYLMISACLFLFGLLNNICSFVTFQRPRSRQVAVGHFLLIITLLNKFSLFSLFLKFLYNFIGSAHWWTNDWFNLTLCKILSYSLSISTRSFYWLASWITIDRLLIALFPTRILFKRPSLAKIISCTTILVICITHWHELLSYTIIQQSRTTVCVLYFEVAIIEHYNRLITFIHYLAPVLIQIVSIIALARHVAQSRAKSRKKPASSRAFLVQQFLASKEQFITPLAIAVSALPQITACFTLACQELLSWQKHLLLCTFLFSYFPQIAAFYLLVFPSSVYRTEFDQTWIGRKMTHA